MDSLIQITQLMKENFCISRLGSHQLPWNTKHFNDLPNAIYIAENSSMVSKSPRLSPLAVARSTDWNIVIIIFDIKTQYTICQRTCPLCIQNCDGGMKQNIFIRNYIILCFSPNNTLTVSEGTSWETRYLRIFFRHRQLKISLRND